MKAVIVLPTHNENENVKILIPQIQSVIKHIDNYIFDILVVDDNSPDGTADAVREMQQTYTNLHLLTGEKKGLGVAYLRGFDYAINQLDADLLFEMDADLQHPPSLLPDFTKGIDEGYDVVIGSRYIEGGGTPDWGIKRKCISRVGNFFARVIAGMYTVHDCTSGYRAIRVSLFNRINKDHLNTRGYAFLSTLLYELLSIWGKSKEIPLLFYDRQYGQTKMSRKDMTEFFFNAFRLRFKSSQRMIRFGIVGGSGIFVNLGLFTLAKNVLYPVFGKGNAILLSSSLIGDEISIIWNFLLNHFWTFNKSTNTDHIFMKMAKFHFIALTSVVINNSVLFALHLGMGMGDIRAKLIGILIAFMWNYIGNVKWTWRE